MGASSNRTADGARCPTSAPHAANGVTSEIVLSLRHGDAYAGRSSTRHPAVVRCASDGDVGKHACIALARAESEMSLTCFRLPPRQQLGDLVRAGAVQVGGEHVAAAGGMQSGVENPGPGLREALASPSSS
jgi:hypothetical protein